MSRQMQKTGQPIWCVVADVAGATWWGPNGETRRHGTSQFNRGAAVYCGPPLWNYAHNTSLVVVGQHRQTRRFVKVMMSAQQLTHWRVEQVTAPDVVAELGREWDHTDASRRRAQALVETLNSRYTN